MKRFQIKPLLFSIIILCVTVALRMYLVHQSAIRWNEELCQLVCVEPIYEVSRSTTKGKEKVESKGKVNEKLLSNSSKNNYKVKKQPSKKIKHIDINIASVDEWKQLPGIGAVFSERIIKFRDRLGGFHGVEQLKEVYGLSIETYAMITPFLSRSVKYETIDLRAIAFKELLAHPYFEYEDVKSIKNYLRKNKIMSKEDLRNASNRDTPWVDKVWPYVRALAKPQNELASNYSK